MVLLTLIFLEFAAFFGLSQLGFSTASMRPPRSEFESWGAWGIPNTLSRQAELCLDVGYRFNSYGARDDERTRIGKDRWIFLGDSFVEGNGVEEDKRISERLERLTGKQVLNFGMSGDFGPLQYLILYKNLASKFEHNGLMVGFLPDNDFTDNDSLFWSQPDRYNSRFRHRPYYVLHPSSEKISVQYGVFGKSIPRKQFDRRPISPEEPFTRQIVDTIQDFINYQIAKAEEYSSLVFLTRNILRNVEAHQLWPSSAGNTNATQASGYFTVDKDRLRATEIILKELAIAVGQRPKVLLIFPRERDILVQNETGLRRGPAFAAFIESLRASGWNVIDLSESPDIRRMSDLSLRCNAHWNASTNQVAAEFIKGKLQELGILN